MKTIGILGGMSWESTQTYYQLINKGIKESLGGLHSAKIVMISVDFAQIEQLQHQGNWHRLGELLAHDAKRVEAAGADMLLIATNTMHKVADQVQDAINVDVVHIADATGEYLRDAGVTKVGLLGTAFTMEQSFYKNRIADRFNIDVVVPNASQRQLVHSVIYNELCLGTINSESRKAYLEVIDSLVSQGAQAVILGCTEIGLLVKPEDTPVKLVDTVQIHAAKAVRLATQ